MSALLAPVTSLLAGLGAAPVGVTLGAPTMTDPGFPDPFVEPGFVDPTFPDPGGFDAAFGLFGVLFVIAVVVMVALGIRKLTAYHRHGIDPTTVDVDLTARLLKSEALRPASPEPAAVAPDPAVAGGEARSVEERLAEIDRLHGAGVIDDDERRDARADVLRDL